jgi:hypothetical protein
MDENLVGYLLNVLDPETHRQVEAHLRANSEARARLERLQRVLAPLALDAAEPEPPPGLALATLARVAEHRCQGLPAAPRSTPQQASGAHARPRFRRADVLAAAVLFLLVGGLATPWLLSQWRQHQVRSCQNNLLLFWRGLSSYSDNYNGQFPQVEADGPFSRAGTVAWKLRDAGLLDDRTSAGCAAQGERPLPSVSLRELEESYRDRPDDYRALCRELAGDYAISLGYYKGQTLCGLRRELGDRQSILADRPGDNQGNSSNHGGGGQNVLDLGGHVRWVTAPTVGYQGDHIYRNWNGRVRAGIDRYDTVLGAGDATP